ncbi:PREDICTED: denticleless protein homolog isoform X2 [Lupinus angustifolius]|uniref:denticleless protein homolog isoform X2 n=1 Tax=Lupinus angustifolius TaxID=3871 RepID=UPI00092E8E82|nr:PREDICTED: denticleless protein homolog isoform X2 [Lupinus angustifolius]
MENSSIPKQSQSIFTHVASRQLNSFQCRKRPRFDGFVSGFNETAAIAVQHNAENSIPLSLSFCKTSKFSHILALSDEDGYMNLFDTRRNLSSSTSFEDNAEKSKICEWVTHHNAVFDVCWIKMKVWDVQEKKCIGVLMGHTGSVKSMSSHPTNSDIIVSGSRDGSFRFWDLRCNSTANRFGDPNIYTSTEVVRGAHISSQAKRVRKSKAASMSITSVLCLKDQVSIATAGAVDSVLKFWDTRNLKTFVTQTCPHPQSTEKKRLHGISSLSQDDSGLFLSASCMDNRIYLYNILQLEKGPLKYFYGSQIDTFFVKASISPDAGHLVSGSSDGKAYVWQVNKPQEKPLALKSHDGEVTVVDWCPSEIGKLATASDDFTVRIWSKNSYVCDRKFPYSIRRRVMAMPRTERKVLLSSEEMCLKSEHKAFLSNETLHQPITSDIPITPPKVHTSEDRKDQLSSSFDPTESSEKTPQSTLKSPSSVLSPPSSLKRTIRDYFLASS